MIENDESKIEEIKRHLYDPQDITHNRIKKGVIHTIGHNVKDKWEEEKTEDNILKMKKKSESISIYKKFFIIAFIFFVGAIGFAFYMFMKGGVSISNENIDIAILGNAFTKGGEELPLQVEITNRNKGSLELASLIIEYPRGAGDNMTDVVRLPKDSIGTILAGETITRNIKVTLFGSEKSIRNVKASLEYRPENSNAIFTREKEYPITISSAPISLNIFSPEAVTSNQDFSFKVVTSLNTALPDQNTILQISYPNNFIFNSAIPAPTMGNSTWDLSKLTKENVFPVEIKGRIVGQDGDEQVFHVYAGTTSETDKSTVGVVYNSLLQKILLVQPFLEAKILVGGQDLPSYTASGGGNVNAQVSWVNNLSSKITDAQIIVSMSGNALDESTIVTGKGFYDSAKNQIIWDKNTVNDLADIEPGERGVVDFSFKPTSLVGASSSIKDPQVKLSVSINGRQVSEGLSYSEINNFTEKIVKIVSDFQISSSASYLSGMMPPKVENETQYNVVWTLSNSANSISGAIARATLPTYVKWIGIFSNKGEDISFNETTREVVWNIGSVNPNTGFNSNREVSFTLSISPSLSQVGSTPQLMKETYLSGMDTFTNTLIKNTRNALTTSLKNDATFQNGFERVIN